MNYMHNIPMITAPLKVNYLESPEWIGGFIIPIEKLCCFCGIVQHVLGRDPLCLADVANLKTERNCG